MKVKIHCTAYIYNRTSVIDSLSSGANIQGCDKGYNEKVLPKNEFHQASLIKKREKNFLIYKEI